MYMSSEKKGMIAASTAYVIFGLSYLFSKMALNITVPVYRAVEDVNLPCAAIAPDITGISRLP